MLTYGFYNSINHDRRYDALQVSRLFDGIIRDGIYMNIGEYFRVTPGNLGDGQLSVLVGTGRAWFNHTWTFNDAPLPVIVPTAEVILNRYDAIVIEVDSRIEVRANSIKLIKGVPATNPSYPTLTQTEMIHQYPLAYVYVASQATSLRQADIKNMIGTSTTPFVTGVLETINADVLLAQWNDQWNRTMSQWTNQWTTFYSQMTADMTNTNNKWKRQWEDWYNRYTSEMTSTRENWDQLWHDWFYGYINSNSLNMAEWKEQTEADFKAWWAALDSMLNGDAGANLAQQIIELKERVNELEKFRNSIVKDSMIPYEIELLIYDHFDDLLDSEDDVILDSEGQNVEARSDKVVNLQASNGEVIEGRSKINLSEDNCQCA